MKYDRAAAVLLAAAYTTDQMAARRFGVTVRSIRNWRNKLSTDSEFSSFFHTKKRTHDEAWAETLPIALRQSVEFIAAASREAQTQKAALLDPDVISALAGAMKLCAEVYYTGKVIDARIAEPDRKADGVFGEVPAGPETYQN
jgi:transposase-like protein